MGLSERKFESIVFDSIIMFKVCWDWLINYALHRSNPFPQFHCSTGSKFFRLGGNRHVFALILGIVDGGRGNFLKVSCNLNKIVWKLWKRWKGLVSVMMQKKFFSPLRSFSMWFWSQVVKIVITTTTVYYYYLLLLLLLSCILFPSA